MKTMKPASEWCEEMFGRGNWVTADTITIKAIQDDSKIEALKYALGISIGRKVLNRNASYIAAVDEIKIFLEAAIERIENGDNMEMIAYCSEIEKPRAK